MRRILCGAMLGLAAAILAGPATAADAPKNAAAAATKNAKPSDAAVDEPKKAASDDPFASLDKPDAKAASPKKHNVNPNKIDLVEDAFALPKGVVLRAAAATSYTKLRQKYLKLVQDVVKRIEDPVNDQDKEKAARELRLYREKIRNELVPIVAMEKKTRLDDARRAQQQEVQQQIQQQQQLRRLRTPLYGT